MRKQAALLILLTLIFLAAPATAASITDSTVTNTNIYAGTTTYNIGPAAEIDSTSTASGISAVADRYLYASSLTNTVAAGLATYSINGLQGSTTISATQGTAQGMDWTYGDGSSATTLDRTHQYSTPGTYSTTLELSNYLTTADISLSTTVSMASSGVSDCTVTNTNIYAGSNALTITPSAYDKGGNSADGITTVSGRYVYAGELSAEVEGAAATLSTTGKQGSTTITDTLGTAQSWAWAFGDDSTADTVGTAEHTYSAPGEYTASVTLKNYLDATGSSAEKILEILPIAPTISISTTTLAQGGTVTLTADGDKWTSIQWQYSTNNGQTWQDITGATEPTYDWQPPNGQYLIRAHVLATSTGFAVDSDTVSLGVYAPPIINAVTINPTVGQYTETITLAAEVTDTGTTPTTYQWQQSPQGQNTWTNIPGATTSLWVGELTVSSPTDFRLLATGTGGTTTSSTVTYYIAAPGEIQTLSATPSVVALPGSTTLSATGSNIVSWEWQELVSGSWVTVGYGASVQESYSAEGTYTYRVLATGADGNTITSESVEVLAGFAPSVSITSPADNVQFPTQSQITVSADITGTDVIYQWDFGSLETITGGNTNPTWVTYLVDGQYTITLRAESIFGSTSDSVTIVSGVMPRPMATDKLDSVSTAPMTAFVESFNVPQGEIIDLPAVFGSLTAPMSDLLPDGMFMVIVFGVIFIMLWIMTKNTAVPSIIGLIFGGFILALLPANYYGAAVAILAISIVGGVIRVFIPPK